MPEWSGFIRELLTAAGQTLDDDVVEELSQHAAATYQAARAEGGSHEEARREVEALVTSWCVDAAALRRRPRRPPIVEAPPSSSPFLAGILHDVRYGARLLKREPGYTLVAIVTMALGIGVATTLFSVAYGVFLRPLPWPDAERLVRVTETRQGRSARIRGTISNGTYLAWSGGPATIEALGGWRRDSRTTLTGEGDPERLDIILATPSLFTVLHARPLLGRLFAPDEGAPGQSAVVILAFGLWQQRFGGRADIIGRAIRLDGRAHTVVGVMPRDFAFPDRESSGWVPWSIPPVVDEQGVRRGTILLALARLRPGVTAAQAAAEGIARARAAPDAGPMALALFGARGPIDVSVSGALDALTAEVRPAVGLLLVAGGLLLATSAANVASLQLARATTRRRELAIRAALGAGAGRLGRQLLVESSIIGAAGGAAGLALAAALHRALPALLPADFPRLDAVTIDARVLLFAVGLSLATSVACGLLPAIHARRVNLVESLSEGGSASAGSTRWQTARARTVIMAGQVAVACVLLVGAALVTRSLLALIRADRGYDPVGLLTAQVPFPARYTDERRAQFLDAVQERMRAHPGVTNAAFGSALPLLSPGGYAIFKLRSPRRPETEIQVEAARRIVSPEYFAALRLRIVAGRPLTAADTATAPPAVVVNRSFVRKYLDGMSVSDAISLKLGRALRFRDAKAGCEIVGVVEDMRQESVEATLQPEIFASYAQVAGAFVGLDPILVVRTAGSPEPYIATLRRLV
ncbi:MAG: hypothetical protein DMG07_04100, partial [Acidobacteria bacterium]